MHSGAHISPLVSGVLGGQDRHNRPTQPGRITPIMTVASVARQMLGAGVRNEVLVLIVPVPARRRRRRPFGRLGG
jgi:hypothetical protein